MASLVQDQRVWLASDGHRPYVPGVVAKAGKPRVPSASQPECTPDIVARAHSPASNVTDATHATVRLPEDGNKEIRVELSQLDAANALTLGEDVAERDNCNLTNLSDATLLHNLRLRHEADEVYTWTGSIITSVNPCKPVPHLYHEAQMQAARARETTRVPAPHVYAIAEEAYADMLTHGRDQSVVVSGISGAGKTEANKLILQYLCWRASEQAAGGDKGAALARGVVQSNPIFEAFGNAVTRMNPNSSRFGKFLRMSFDRAGGFAGASFSTFLLEKSRLVKNTPDARTFHVFFQLLAGAPDEHLAALELAPADVWRTLAGLLHLGNVCFDGGDDADSSVGAASAATLAAAEELLGLRGLARDLTIHEVQAGGGRLSLHESPLTAEQAAHSRDSLAKRVYLHLFDGLVRSLNESLRPIGGDAGAGRTWIGCLDVFGFELFGTCSTSSALRTSALRTSICGPSSTCALLRYCHGHCVCRVCRDSDQCSDVSEQRDSTINVCARSFRDLIMSKNKHTKQTKQTKQHQNQTKNTKNKHIKTNKRNKSKTNKSK